MQYPVWCPEKFEHLQTSMWLRPNHTDKQRIPAIADPGFMLTIYLPTCSSSVSSEILAYCREIIVGGAKKKVPFKGRTA